MKKDSLTVNIYQINAWHMPSNKPSILLVHGIGVSSEYYFPFMNQLASDFDVHSIDLPGYGKTPKPKKTLSIQDLSDIVVGYAEQTGKTFTLVGQSMGCQVVTHAANTAPHLFTRLILIAPTTNKKERSLLQQAVRLGQDTLHESFAANRVVFRNYLRMGMVRYIETAHMMVNDQLEETIAKVTIPILIVTGEKDKIAPYEWGLYLVAKASSAEIVELKSAPHLLQFAKPDELAALTRDFVLS
ncbi:MAG: alpha/beta hydrolase [Candidatus Microsaccharimonas sp.]